MPWPEGTGPSQPVLVVVNGVGRLRRGSSSTHSPTRPPACAPARPPTHL